MIFNKNDSTKADARKLSPKETSTPKLKSQPRSTSYPHGPSSQKTFEQVTGPLDHNENKISVQSSD